MTAPQHKLALQQLADMEALPAFIEACQHDLQLSPQHQAALSVIADEVVSNIFRHNPAPVAVLLAICRTGKQLILQIEDTGMPFNPLDSPPPRVDLPLAEREPGGLGIILTRSLSDSIRYLYAKQKNLLTIIKEVH